MNSCECLFDNCKFGGMHESLSSRRPPHHPYSHLLWFLTSLDAVNFFTPLDTARLFFEGGRGRSDSVGLRGGVFKELWPRLSPSPLHTPTTRRQRASPPLPPAGRESEIAVSLHRWCGCPPSPSEIPLQFLEIW